MFDTRHSRCAYHLCVLWLCGLVGCSTEATRPSARSHAAGSGTTGFAGSAGPGVLYPERCLQDCEDFPREPLFDSEGAAPPMNAAALFGGPDNFEGTGPCVIEPQLSQGDQPGALFPNNWLRPRFRFQAAGSQNLWEIRLRAERERNDLVAYTTRTTWAVPRDVWQSMAKNLPDDAITVTIRGLDQRDPKRPVGTRGTFTIAPVAALGKMVYWATTSSDVGPSSSKLVGFDVGDESVIDALTVPQVGEREILAAGGRELRGRYDDPHGVAAGAVQCIGCHVSTPGGDAVAFTDHWPWNNVLASVEKTSIGARPTYLSTYAELLLNQPWLGMQTFSGRHFTPGDRVVVSVYSPRNGQNSVGYSDGVPYPSRSDRLIWIDLESQATYSMDQTAGDVQQQLNNSINAELGRSFGMLALDGETRSVAAPAFSHDGSRVVYTSADATQDGRIGGNNQEVDLHMVPYNERRGGTVEPVNGAAEPHVAEYYPAFSADDALLAYNRVATLDSKPIYYRPDGEIYVIPSAGGTPTRLAANDPPACTAQKSPGIINSWPKWSPSVSPVPAVDVEFGKARTFYWLVFSSARAYEGQFELQRNQYSPDDTRASQLYVTAIARNDSTGQLTTYPAIYLWNQDPKTSNLTPAWDEFKIPEVPVVPE